MPSVQFQSLVSMMRARPWNHNATIAEFRDRFERLAPLLGPPVEGVRIEPLQIGALFAEEFIPNDAVPEAVCLFFHGGGYCIGSLNTHRSFASRLARAAGVRVISVEYRLAPEHRFPAAVDDAVEAYRWLLARGLSEHRIAVAGDSAGGGLALAMIAAVRDATEPIPAACVCLSPWTDLAITGASVDSKAAADPLLAPWELHMFARHYLGHTDPRTPLASPLYADFAGFPPLLVHVGGMEILRDDSTRLVERARAAGVNVEFVLDPEMIHVWHFFAPLIPEGEQAVGEVGRYLHRMVTRH